MKCKIKIGQILLIGSVYILFSVLMESQNQEPVVTSSHQIQEHQNNSLKYRKSVLDQMCRMYQNPFRPEEYSLHHQRDLAQLHSFQYFKFKNEYLVFWKCYGMFLLLINIMSDETSRTVFM